MAVAYWPPGGGGGSSPVAVNGEASSASIGNGVTSHSVSFGTAFADTTYGIVFSIGNAVDAHPIFLQGVVTAKSTTGFTVTFNAPTDSVNYTLEWAALETV